MTTCPICGSDHSAQVWGPITTPEPIKTKVKTFHFEVTSKNELVDFQEILSEALGECDPKHIQELYNDFQAGDWVGFEETIGEIIRAYHKEVMEVRGD